MTPQRSNRTDAKTMTTVREFSQAESPVRAVRTDINKNAMKTEKSFAGVFYREMRGGE